jgi:DnaJ-class molecular chaperone
MLGEFNIKNMRVIKEKCSQCEGVGKVKWECGHQEMCLKCKGSGELLPLGSSILIRWCQLF